MGAKASPSGLHVLYGGLGIGKLQFNKFLTIPAVNFFTIFGHQNPENLKCWIRIRIETNADPKHWFYIPILFVKFTMYGSVLGYEAKTLTESLVFVGTLF